MGRGFTRVLPDALVAVVVLVLTWPMWTTAGYGLARDMVFSPRAPWTLDAIGMGSSLPRAVPLDGVLAAATSVVDGAVVFRVAVAGVLLAAGWGAHRLLAVVVQEVSPAARCLVGVAAVWNPYVVERLALGQWALLATYAAMWWLLPVVRRVLAGERRAWWASVCLILVASLTPTGGALVLMVVVATLVVVVVHRDSIARAVRLLLVAVAAQLPWVLAGVLGAASATSDPLGVEVFAARAERPGGVWPSLLTTGGVWSPFQVPASLTSWGGHALTVLVVVVLLAGGARMARREQALALAAVVGFVLAGLAHLPGGGDALAWAVEHVPGSGLLRDGQKWLLPYVVVVVSSAGIAVTRAERALRRRDSDLGALLVGAMALLPVVLVPDAAGRTWQALEPVTYPDDLTRAVAVLDDPDAVGEVVTLPWASYREFSWGNPVSAADPLPRWTERPTVVSDALLTESGSVAGEDTRAREVETALARTDVPLAESLAAADVGWVLVYADQPGAAELDTSGLTPVVDGSDVRLFRVPGADREPESSVDSAGPVAVAAVAAVDAAWGVALLGGLLGGLIVAVRARRLSREVTDQ